MKTFFKSFAVLAGLTLLVAGCAQDEFLSQKDGGDTVVTFTAEFPSAPATKAALDNDGNAVSVNRCIMEIYYGDSRYDRLYEPVSGNTATFKVTLVSNRTYTVAFWADHVHTEGSVPTEEELVIDSCYYTADGLQAVALNGTYAGNDDKRDAFAYSGKFTVAQGGSAFNAKLTRPFAQINVITTDVKTVAKVATLVPEQVGVVIKKASTCYNVLDSTAVANQTEDLEYTASIYNWDADTTLSTLSMDYIFAEKTKSVIDIDWNAKHGTDTEVAHTFSNIPYQRNYRTNIKGDLLTTVGSWNVTVAPAWTNEGTGEFEVIVIVANTVEEAQEKIEENKAANKTVELQIKEQITDTKKLSIPDNTTTPNWVFKIENMTSTGAIVVEDDNPDNNDVNFKNSAEVVVPEGMTAEQVTFNTPKAHGTVSGDFGRIDATTGGTTLEVKAGSTVKEIYVHKGNVALYGEVDHIYRADGNESTVIVNIYDGANWTAWNDEKASTGIKPIVNVGTYKFDPTGYNLTGSAVTDNGDGTWTVSVQIKIGDKAYFTLNEALAEVKDGETIIVGKVTDTPETIGAIANVNGKTFTIKGTDKELSIVKIGNGNTGGEGACDYRFEGANVAFENLTFAETSGDANYLGIVRPAKLTFDGCIFTGRTTYWGNDCTIKNSTFEHADAYDYCLWTWGCANMTIQNTVFNTQGKAIKMYGAGTCVLNVENCTFNSNGKHEGADKPAIAINTLQYTTDYTLNITNCTQNGFIAGATGSAMFGSDLASEVSGNLDVYVDGVLVWKDGAIVNAIANAAQMKAFADYVNHGIGNVSGAFSLEADIDLAGIDWNPIGQTGKNQFKGTFDGKNHTISNLTINNTDESENCATGIFGWLNTATVKNINVDLANVAGHHNVGVIAGYMEANSTCTIENCHVSGATISCTYANGDADGDKCGGIVGFAGNGGDTVTGCTVSNSKISAGRDAGQVVGAAEEANVANCSATDVTVSFAGTGRNENIRNEVIGRVL